MAQALIALGSNLGNRLASISLALRHLRQTPGTHLVRVSDLFETAPWGMAGQPSFINAAAVITTPRSAPALLDRLQQIEAAGGRRRSRAAQRWGPRPLDLDLLLYDAMVLRTHDLELPHPRMVGRAFVLKPAAQIAGDWVHPLLGLTMDQLCRQCREQGDSLRRLPAGLKVQSHGFFAAAQRHRTQRNWGPRQD